MHIVFNWKLSSIRTDCAWMAYSVIDLKKVLKKQPYNNTIERTSFYIRSSTYRLAPWPSDDRRKSKPRGGVVARDDDAASNERKAANIEL